ncbi:MAG: flagellar protein export ATPase FliI [Candidatus Sericytochromatia bacterium]|nr:flagellar protein export ATPase FliI [Candidatus Sericytochromatia bacterium]
MTIDFSQYHAALAGLDPFRNAGRVSQVIGAVIESEGPSCHVGEYCTIYPTPNSPGIAAETVGFKEDKILLMCLGDISGIRPGSQVVATGEPQTMPVGDELLGRIVDGLGQPIDNLGPLRTRKRYPLDNNPPNPLTRRRITERLCFGVRAIDGLLTVGQGQRIGIFAGSGVGKSTLMGMIARNSEADVNVIGLVGERGREVRDFVERDLGPEGLAKSVVVACTSDMPALLRIKGAFAATAVAEYFRDQGKNVLLMMDSVTRFAMAQREVGLAVGEPPATKGYTPSVFALLPRLMERAGTSDIGTITALYTVLVEGSDMEEPIADAVRGILDGHIVLSRDLAHQNHYPAIDVLASLSRLMSEIATSQQKEAAGMMRELIATYRKAEDLINIGAYVQGNNQQIDFAIYMHDKIDEFLKQGVDEPMAYPEMLEQLIGLFGQY